MCVSVCLASLMAAKDTTLERADFTLQLFMFCSRGKGWVNVSDFLSFHFLSAAVPLVFKLGQA